MQRVEDVGADDRVVIGVELFAVRPGITNLFRDCPGWEFAGAGRRAR